MESSWKKVKWLSELGIAFVQAQQWNMSETVWMDLRAMIHSMEVDSGRASPLVELVTTLVQAQQWKQATLLWQEMEKSARNLTWDSVRYRVLRALILVLIQEHQWEWAERAARNFAHGYVRDRLLEDLGEAFMQTRQLERAEAVVRDIGERRKKVEALGNLGTAFVQAHQWGWRRHAHTLWSEAEALARKPATNLDEYRENMNALVALGGALVQAKQWKRAEILWSEAETLARRVEDQLGGEEGERIVTQLVEAFALVQQWDRAEGIASSLNASVVDSVLCELISEMVYKKQWARATVIMQRIQNREKKLRGLSSLAHSLAQAKRWEEAVVHCAVAETMIHDMQDKDKVFPLIGLASIFAKSQHSEHARVLWTEAEVIARGLEGLDKAYSLAALGVSLAKAQQWIGAEALTHFIEREDLKAEVLQAVADGLEENRNYEDLISFIQRSWGCAEARGYCVSLLPLAKGLLPLQPELAATFCDAFSWIDTFF